MTNYDALVSAATILAETNPETAEKLQNMADTLQRRAERAKVRKANTPAKPSKTHIANVEFFDEHIMSIVEEHGVVGSRTYKGKAVCKTVPEQVRHRLAPCCPPGPQGR